MSSPLVIVESPTKAKTIGRFLSGKATVLASQGHIRDLPDHALGVDIARDFTPEYELTDNGKRIVASLKKAARTASSIYLATDPDREGEAISWHLQEVLRSATKAPFHRITFHEITNSAIANSFANPGKIDQNMVNAQQARRVIDRIVGYQVSPLLWKNIQKGTSAGRVQTVALRLVVEREREIQAFQPQEYWNLDAEFSTQNPAARFKARLTHVNHEKILISQGEAAEKLAKALESSGVTHKISKVTSSPRKKHPAPPFQTSTLQQAAGSALHIGASQTMKIAQELYEGIDLGSGQVGLITYMRTDSFHISQEAQQAARKFITATYGAEYLPAVPNVYKARKLAQEAHEAIRPTDLTLTPDSIASCLTSQQLKVYRLIWNRFLASQMAPAQQMDHVIEVESCGGSLQKLTSDGLTEKTAGGNGVICTFRAAARETLFPGFLKIYNIREVGESEDPDEALNSLPSLPQGIPCDMNALQKQQCFTQPPARYSEASLVKALEQNGVGRPSTYATTVNTIQQRAYVEKDKGSLHPTDLGCRTADFLIQEMPMLFDVGFTAQMETELDTVEEGNLDWVRMLRNFYGKFQTWSGCTSANSSRDIQQILALFPEDFKFAPAVKKGRRTYDDEEFIEKLKEQMAKKKSPTDRQWQALLMTVARYLPEYPEMQKVLDAMGYGDAIRKNLATLKQAAEKPKIAVTPEIQTLLAAMKDLKYNPPKKVRNRTYDDGKFIQSLQEQVNGGSGLTEAQTSALLRIAANYAAKIPGYATVTAPFAAAVPEPAAAELPDGPDKKNLSELMKLPDEIKEWRPVVKKGRFTYDDKKFLTSIQENFDQRGQLTPRQIAAFLKTLKNYADQIPNLDRRLEALQLESALPDQPKPELLEEECPLCHAKLIRRWHKGKSFVGCSAFPKCRYIRK